MDYLTPSVTERECAEFLQQEFPRSMLDEEDADFLTPDTYLRFSCARDGNYAKACAMLRNCVEWRKTYKPHKITREDVQKAMKQLTLTVAGHCRAGRPLVIITVGAPNACEAGDRLKQMVFVMEEFRRKGYGQLTWIIDFYEMGKHPRDSRSIETRRETMRVLQDFYPNILGALLLYRMPWYAKALFTVARHFIDKKTSEKMFTLGNDESLLFKFVEKDSLPPRLGGTLAADADTALESSTSCFIAPDDAAGERALNGFNVKDLIPCDGRETVEDNVICL